MMSWSINLIYVFQERSTSNNFNILDVRVDLQGYIQNYLLFPHNIVFMCSTASSSLILSFKGTFQNHLSIAILLLLYLILNLTTFFL